MNKQLSVWLEKAKKSKSSLWFLNVVLHRAIPFNKPHGIKIKNIEDGLVQTIIPCKRRNFNHIKGVHACGMATAAEFCAGLLLMSELDASKYRLIMRNLSATYHYQAKSNITATCQLSKETIKEKIIQPLETKDAIFYTCTSELHDKENNHVATISTEWQLKNWKKVKTAV